MKLQLKSVVFKTNNLKGTMDFFVKQLGLPAKESSVDHFVIHWKNIRVLFIRSHNDFSPELYFSQNNSKPTTSELMQLIDPNGIKVIISPAVQ